MSRSPQVFGLLVASLLTLPAFAQGRAPTACNEENASCREDCTMDFGTSQRTQSQLLKCIDACRTTHQRCTERWNELREANIDPDPPRQGAQQVGDTFISEETPVPGANLEGEPARTTAPRSDETGRTRYATDEDARPESTRDEPSEPAMRVEHENYNEGISLPPDEPGSGTPSPAPREQTERPRNERKSERAAKASSSNSSSDKKPRKSHPDLPPEPENDISDWDPDGR